MRTLSFFLGLLLLLGQSTVLHAAQRQETMTTYYPAPYGEYQTITWGDPSTSRGKLQADQGSSIELGGVGIPYIDFSNDATIDYDMRIILAADNLLKIEGVTNGRLHISNTMSLQSVSGAQAGGVEGSLRYRSDRHNFTYYDGSSWKDLGAYDLDDVDVYTKMFDGSGTATLVDIPAGSGVLLGGSISGDLLINIRITVDGTKTLVIRNYNENPPAGSNIVYTSETEANDNTNDITIVALPGPIKFNTSLSITYQDGRNGLDDSLCSGVAYVVQ